MNQHFGDFVRWKKARMGLENKDLAARLGCDKKTVTNILRYADPKQVSDTFISRLAALFGFDSERAFLDSWREGLPPLKADQLVVDDNGPPRAPNGAASGGSAQGPGHKGNVPRRSKSRKR